MGRTPSPERRSKRPGRSRLAPENAQSLWNDYHRTNSDDARNRLVEAYAPLVRVVATRLAADLPDSVQLDDLVSVGMFGLMDAIERYNPRRGARFETYCAVRIRGAMLDELRQLNWAPRQQSSRSAKIGSATQSLVGELGRQPTEEEIAERCGLSERQVRSIGQTARHVSMSAALGDDQEGDGMHAIEVLEASGVYDPVDLLEERERREVLAREVQRLGPSERLVVMLYYFEELTLREIGEVLGLTESRVCQIRSAVLQRLKQRLAELEEAR
jgi:RNA polymerase sigma factor for flagellar operon FliA